MKIDTNANRWMSISKGEQKQGKFTKSEIKKNH